MITDEKYRKFVEERAKEIAAENTTAVDEMRASESWRNKIADSAIRRLESEPVDRARCMSCFGRGYYETSFWGNPTGQVTKHQCKECGGTGKVK